MESNSPPYFFCGDSFKERRSSIDNRSLYLVLFAFRIIFSPFNIGLTEELGLSIKVDGDITCLIVRRALKSNDK